MDKKSVLITGSSRGIGKAICEYFSKEGHHIYCPTREELDLNSPHSITEFLSDNNHFDCVINCAGVNNLEVLQHMGEYFACEEMEINFNAPFTICQALLPYMMEKRYGRILNIGSIWIDITKPSRGKYSISKSALHSYTKQIAIEYGPFEILANTLSPGFVKTDLTFKNNTEEEIYDLQREIPVKRLATPEEIAKWAYLLTIENTYINGQNITIDGGYSVCA